MRRHRNATKARPMPLAPTPLRVGAALMWAARVLAQESETPALDAELLLGHIGGKRREWMLAYPEAPLTGAQRRGLFRAVCARLMGFSVAAIAGRAAFFRHEFVVGPKVLVPRPETEMLVQLALETAAPAPNGTFVDIGCGSGCIGISLALARPSWQAVLTDYSADALEISRRNACRLGAPNAWVVRSDLLCTLPPRPRARAEQHPRIVVANLPYLPAGHAHQSTRREPQNALFSGQGGVAHLRRCLMQLPSIRPTAAFLEFHPPAAKHLLAFCARLFPRARATVHRDLADRLRIIELRF